MFGFGKKVKPVVAKELERDEDSLEKKPLEAKLAKTRKPFLSGLRNLLSSKKTLDDEVLTDIETRLLMADVGLESTTEILSGLKQAFKLRPEHDQIMQILATQMLKILKPIEQKFNLKPSQSPLVILVVGVNGAGKTTTIGKLARKLQEAGNSVMLAAGDTFRAAAVEQLSTWGERNNISVVAQKTGSDSASVIFDAISSAKAKKMDVLIADTAGRLHTQTNLMEELKKIKRVMRKHDVAYPHETMLVLDATVGQNAINQAEKFNQAIGVDSLILSKMDGTAKGGILFALANKIKIPVRFVGVGESINDLRDFNAEKFVHAITAE